MKTLKSRTINEQIMLSTSHKESSSHTRTSKMSVISEQARLEMQQIIKREAAITREENKKEKEAQKCMASYGRFGKFCRHIRSCVVWVSIAGIYYFAFHFAKFDFNTSNDESCNTKTDHESCNCHNKTGNGGICFNSSSEISQTCVDKGLCPLCPAMDHLTLLFLCLSYITTFCCFQYLKPLISKKYANRKNAAKTQRIVDLELSLVKAIHETEMEHVHNPLEQKQFNIPSSGMVHLSQHACFVFKISQVVWINRG